MLPFLLLGKDDNYLHSCLTVSELPPRPPQVGLSPLPLLLCQLNLPMFISPVPSELQLHLDTETWGGSLVSSPAESVGMLPASPAARTLCQAGNPVKFLPRIH